MPFFSGFMDGYVQAETVPTASGSTEFAIFGRTGSGSGWFSSLDMYLSCSDVSGNSPSASMNMSLCVANSSYISGDMNVSIGGEYAKSVAYVELSLWNTGASGYIPMAITGGGVGGGSSFAGATVGTGYMNMYLARNPSETIDIYLHGQGDGISGTLDMIMPSALSVNSGVAIAIPQTYARYSGMLDIYTHGW